MNVNVGDKGKEKGPSNLQGQISLSSYNSNVNYVSLIAEAFYVQVDEVEWWIDSGCYKACVQRPSMFQDL
ncbi:unnamed protein product [Rhodiola kirilowii]